MLLADRPARQGLEFHAHSENGTVLHGIHFVSPNARSLTVIDRQGAIADKAIKNVAISIADFGVVGREQVPREIASRAETADVSAHQD